MHFRLSAHIKSLLLLAASLLSLNAAAAPRGWEVVKTERADVKTVARDSDIEVKAASGIIIVTSGHHTPIKVFTILGRLVNSDTLAPGKSMLQLPAHGVYIVKIGDLTCKVAV